MNAQGRRLTKSQFKVSVKVIEINWNLHKNTKSTSKPARPNFSQEFQKINQPEKFFKNPPRIHFLKYPRQTLESCVWKTSFSKITKQFHKEIELCYKAKILKSGDLILLDPQNWWKVENFMCTCFLNII